MEFLSKFQFFKLQEYKNFIFSLTLLLSLHCYSLVQNSKVKDINRFLPVNQAPVFDSSQFFYTVPEDIALGKSVGKVSATDRDGDRLTYSIKSGNTNSMLSINSSTGVISVAKNLNHHTQDSFNLIVKVSDVMGLSDESSVIIKVNAGEKVIDFDKIIWSSATSEPYGTHEVHGEVLKGKLYIFGGYDVQKRPKYLPTKRAFVFDPVAGKWTAIADLPHTPRGTNFGGVTHQGLTSDGTDIYFAGGYPSNPAGTNQAFSTKEVWKYNTALNTYTALPDLPIALAAGQLRYLKGKIHYMGGANRFRRDTSVHYALDLDHLSAGWKVLAPVLNATNHPGSTVFEGKIYFLGGSYFQDTKAIPQKTVEAYDPNTNTWTKLADLPTAIYHISSSVVVMGDRILVLGGETSHTSKANFVTAYSPASNTWTKLTPLPLARAAGVAGVLNGNIYFSGGDFKNNSFKGVPVPVNIKVDSFTLINADTDQPIRTLISGDTLNLATLPTMNLNIRANTNAARVGSVLFNLTGPEINNLTENLYPYTLFGDDNNGDYFAWTPLNGNYTLKATPYSASGGTGTAGTAKTIFFTVINNSTQVITLSPVADAFVRNGSYAGINYGGDTTVEIKSSLSGGFTRYAYLKFSLAGISNISSATVRLYGSNLTDTSGKNISVYGVDNDAWTENGINFSNAPVAGNAALSSTVVSGVVKYYEFDVTNFVITQITADKTVSLMLKDPQNSVLNFVFNSRENSKNLPQLLIKIDSSAAQHKYLLAEMPAPK